MTTGSTINMRTNMTASMTANMTTNIGEGVTLLNNYITDGMSPSRLLNLVQETWVTLLFLGKFRLT